MANNRDVRLGIEIETAGEDGIKRLASAVRALGKEGDPAAAEYARLANELDRLSQQAGAIQSLQALRLDVEKLTSAEVASVAAAKAATDAYEAQSKATGELRDAQARARTEAAAAKTAYDDLKLAYQTLKNEGRAAAQSQDGFNASLREARQQVDEQNRALKARRDELSATDRAVREAAASEKLLRQEYEATSRAATSTQTALEAQSTAMQRAESLATALGAEVKDLAAAEARLLETTQAYVTQVAERRAQASRDQADADRLAAIEARALAEAQEQAHVAAASELAQVKESLQFIDRYAKAQADAARATAELTLAEERRLARLRESSAADALAATEARGLAEAKEKGRAAAEAELAAIKDSEDFTRRYAAAATAAAAATLALAEADERAALAAREAAAAEAAAIAEFNKAAEAARITNFWATELHRLDVEAEAAAASTKRVADAGEAVTRAFGQTGVRSLQAIRAEMNSVGESLTLLQRQFKAGAIGADDLARASSSAQVRLATLRTELQTIPSLPNVFEGINSSINSLISRFGSLTAAVATLGFVVKPVLDADIAFEGLRRTLTIVTGSAETAAQQIAFLRTTANQAGLSAGQLAQSFQLFEASLLQSGQSIQTTQQLFSGIAAAAGRFGLSTDRVNGILLALGQIANKGKLQLEELQGQIGESLPGALKLAADSLGITTAQLQALLKDGKVLAEDFLPAFGKQLTATFGGGTAPVEGLAQAFNRLKNAATETSQKLVDTAAYKGLTATLDALARNFDTVVSGTVSLGKAFLAFKAIDIAREFFGIKAAAELAASAKLKDVEVTIASTVATKAAATAIAVETEALAVNTVARVANTAAAGAGAVIGTALVNTFEKTGAAVAGASSKIGGFIGALGGPYGLALTVAIAFQEQLGNGLAFIAAKASGAVDTIKRNEEALRKLAEADKVRAEAAKAAAEIVTTSFVKVQVAFDKQITAAETQIQVSEKLVKAKKEEGATAVTLAELSGNEAAAKTAAAKAAGANEAAIRSELKAKQTEVTLLEQERDALAKAAGAQETWTESRREFFKDFDAKLEKKKADLEVTRQQAEADGVAADKAFLAAQAYKDNAGSIAKFRDAVEVAKIIYEQMVKLFKEGLVTQQQVTQSARDLAVAQGQLKDAYEDATAAIHRRISVVKELGSLNQQDLDIKRKAIEVDQRIADLTGQYQDKLNAGVKLKGLDVAASEQKIRVAEEEARLLREEARLLQEKLQINDPLYAQKKREIDAIIASAKAKANEGLIERENVRQLGVELGVLNGTLYKGVIAFNSVGDAAGRAAAEVKRVAEETARTAAELSALSSRATELYNEPAQVLARKKAAGKLTADDKESAATNLEAARNNLFLAQENGNAMNASDFIAEFARARAISEQINNAGNFAPTNNYGTFVGGNGRSAFGPQVTTPVPAPSPATGTASGNSVGTGSTHTLNINVGGKSFQVQTSGQQVSEQLMREIEAAFRSAGNG